MNTIGYLLTAGDGTNDKAGAIGCIATDEHVLGVFGMLWLEESHSKKHQFRFDNLRFACFYHDRTSTFGVRFPIDWLYPYTCNVPFFA